MQLNATCKKTGNCKQHTIGKLTFSLRMNDLEYKYKAMAARSV